VGLRIRFTPSTLFMWEAKVCTLTHLYLTLYSKSASLTYLDYFDSLQTLSSVLHHVQVALGRRTENACRQHPSIRIRTCRARRHNTNVGSFPQDFNAMVYLALTHCYHLLRVIFFGRHFYSEGGRSITNAILLTTHLSSSPSFSPLIAWKKFLPDS
jgi:hypothetical protein